MSHPTLLKHNLSRWWQGLHFRIRFIWLNGLYHKGRNRRNVWLVTIPTSIDPVEAYVIARNEEELQAFIRLKGWGGPYIRGYELQIRRLNWYDDVYISR